MWESVGERELLAKLDAWIEDFHKIFFIFHQENPAESRRLIEAFYEWKCKKATNKRILVLAAQEAKGKSDREVTYCQISEEEAQALYRLYHMYEFSERFQVISGTKRWGSLFCLADTGVLCMEEVWEALLY